MRERLPNWFRKKFPDIRKILYVREILERYKLHTICDSACCPNIGDCFERKTATFLILGDICTRNCRFCAVKKGIPEPVDEGEIDRLSKAVSELNLRYVVLTSVTRDDLPDFGANHFKRVIETLKKGGIIVEALIPDFKGDKGALSMVLEASPHVLAHNIETVPRLYGKVRPEADYKRSIELLAEVKRKKKNILTKSGLMVGLGEKDEEIFEVFRDLREAECDIVTIGQYLSPSLEHYPVKRFVEPEIFLEYEKIARDMGFKEVVSGPLVRSSFKSEEIWMNKRWV